MERGNLQFYYILKKKKKTVKEKFLPDIHLMCRVV